MKPVFEGKEGKCGICIFTHRGTGKQIPFKKKNSGGAEVKGTKYFYTSLFGICEFTFVVTDTPKLLPLVNSGQN